MYIIFVFEFVGLVEIFGDNDWRFCIFGGVLLRGFWGLDDIMLIGLEIWFNRGLVIILVGGV